MTQHIELTYQIPEHQTGMRLDQALAEQYPDYSRSRLKAWILAGYVCIHDQVVTKPRDKVIVGQQISIHAVIEDEVKQEPEAIELNCVFEDEHILVISKNGFAVN